MPPRYTVVLQWSEADQAYLVTLPEWADRVLSPVTHGDSYEETVKQGLEAMEALVASAQKHGESWPVPQVFAAAP